jgi:uncharacterized protein YqeY
MKTPRQLRDVLPVAICIIPFLAGCGTDGSQPAPSAASDAQQAAPAHDPDDVPITEADVERPANYAAAVARIRSYRDTIRDEVAAGRPTKAHRPLDELDIVLNWLPEIARDSNVPKENWESINTTAQQLRELMGKVHAQIDAGEKPDYEAVASDVEQAIEHLEQVQPAAA